MPSSNPKSTFLRGLFDSLPIVLVAGPFALLFGVVATEAGLRVTEVMGFSLVVVAGAAQFAAVQLMAQDAPTLIILATALAVNLRMAMYSAALAPHLGAAPLWQRAFAAYVLVDQAYALSSLKYEMRPDMTLGARLAYYFGTVAIIMPVWFLFTYVGAVVGTRIPPEYALDFALPITFIAMVAPALRTVAHVAAAVTSVLAALALAWMPFGSGLLLATALAMIVGARVELILERRGA